ncbi:hypothetical protein BJ322DRAFT_1175821 [Thelephora terrestris]|uniref:Transmembrane protein n=1 Tax=Thelephora terrestris TaxID=56493 RepID=A0A9P6L0S1_9AGAM|nr:hypothetical protein BJ322DRAFT_1175821 [Thelephora terrestris]
MEGYLLFALFPSFHYCFLDKMILLPAFSAAVLLLWSLLLTSGPMYTPIISIPALISPVLAPDLSHVHGPSIIIFAGICNAAITLTFPACDPSGIPAQSSSPPDASSLPGASIPPVAAGSLWALWLMMVSLVLGCVCIIVCANNAVRPTSIVSTPSEHPAYQPPSPSSFPPSPTEVGPNTDWTPLSQPSAAGSFRRQAFAGAFVPSTVDSGYGGSPFIPRFATRTERKSQLRVVTSAHDDSPIPAGPLPAPVLGSGSDDTSPISSPSTPFFNPPTHQGLGFAPHMVTDDPFWAPDSAPCNPVSECPLDPMAIQKPIPSHPPKNRISNPTGFAPVTTPVSSKRTGAFDQDDSRKARDAYLRLQAERGHAAPSRLYSDATSKRASTLAMSPNIRALRDLVDDEKATLVKIRELCSALDCTNCWPSTVEELAASRSSLGSSYSSERGSAVSEETEPIPALPMGMEMLFDERNPFDADKTSNPTPSPHSVFASSRTKKSSPSPETLVVPALPSIDVGLQLILEAIGKQEEVSFYSGSESERLSEAATSANLTLGEAPSFLDDISSLSIRRSSKAVAVKDEDTRPAPPPVIDTSPSSLVPEDLAPVDSTSIPSPHNSIPPPSTPPIDTSLSFGRIGIFLDDIRELIDMVRVLSSA